MDHPESRRKERISLNKFRDSHRALLYLPWWNSACDIMESAILSLGFNLSGTTTTSCCSILMEVAHELAEKLDDFVAPIVSDALPKDVTERCQQNQIYRGLFISSLGTPSDWTQQVFVEFPFLEGLISSFTTNCAKNVVLCLHKLRDSWDELHAPGHLLCNQSPTATLTLLKPTDSDSHCGGQRVLILCFSDSRKLVYKPFGGKPASLFYDFLQLIPSDALKHRLTGMRVEIPPSQQQDSGRDFYWAEYIENLPCQDANEVAAFYYRAGALVSFCGALGFSDGHYGNIIANGSLPVIVDCETLFQPHREYDDPNDLLGAAMKTMLLQETPSLFSANDMWLAGFQHSAQIDYATSSLTILNERTNLMSLQYDSYSEESKVNSPAIPMLHGQAQYLKDFLPYFQDGYRDAWSGLRARKRNFDFAQGVDSWIENCKGSPIRVVLRATSFYIIALRSLQQPSSLRSLAAASAAAMHAMTLFCDDIHPDTWQEEVAAILQFDVPSFYSCVGVELIKEEVQQQQQQVQSLIAFNANAPGYSFPLFEWRPNLLLDPPSESAVETALGYLSTQILGKNICEVMEVSDGSSAHCIAAIAEELLVSVFSPTAVDIGALNGGLYSGMVGIALFFAALSASDIALTVFDTAATEIVNKIISGAKSERHETTTLQQLATPSCQGGFWGSASDAYGLSLAGVFADKPEWITAALLMCTENITLAGIQSNGDYDITGGVSGCALAMLAVRFSASKVRDIDVELISSLDALIIACGSKIFDDILKSSNNEILGWSNEVLSTTEKVIAAGLAHGIAGCVLALRRLGHFYGFPEWVAAAKDAAEREDTFCIGGNYDKKLIVSNNELEKSDTIEVADYLHDGSFSWCWGSPGIALSRNAPVGCDSTTDLLLIPRLPPIEKAHLFSEDSEISLCCGTVGRFEIAMELELADRHECLKAIVKSYAKQGSSSLNEKTRFGFMKGLSGIGYAILRASSLANNKFPCILTLDWHGIHEDS